MIGLLTGAFGIGTAIGFAAGGVFAEALSWRLIFLAGAVLVAAGLVLIVVFVPRSRSTERGSFDHPGMLLLGGASVSVLLALTLGAQMGWLSVVPILLLAAAIACTVLWVRVETRVPDPLVDLRVFSGRPVLFTNIATVAQGWVLFGTFFLLPHYVRVDPDVAGYGLGADATQAGLFLVPAALGQLLAGPTAGTPSRRVSASRVFAAGLGLAAISMVVLATSGQSVARVVLGAFLVGTGAGLSIQTSSTLAAQGVEAGKTSISTAVNSTVRRLAGGIGGQVSATLLADMATPGGRPGHAAFVVAFLIAAGPALLGSVLALFIPRVDQQGLEE